MVEIVKPSVCGLKSIRKMEYAQVENRAVYEEWANSVGTGLDKLHGGSTKFAQTYCRLNTNEKLSVI